MTHVGSGNQRSFHHPGRDAFLGQLVQRYRTSANAADFLGDVIATVDRCREMTGPDRREYRLVMTDHGFAGDASILIRQETDGLPPSHYVFVRQGAVVSELIIRGDFTDDEIRTLADRPRRGSVTRLRPAETAPPRAGGVDPVGTMVGRGGVLRSTVRY